MKEIVKTIFPAVYFMYGLYYDMETNKVLGSIKIDKKGRYIFDPFDQDSLQGNKSDKK